MSVLFVLVWDTCVDEYRRACGTEKDVRREFLIVHDGVDAESGGKSLAQGNVNGSDASVLDGGKANGTRATPSGTEEGEMYTFWQIARTSLIFCPIWFAANYSYNKSLSLTSVSSNTILSSTSGTSPSLDSSSLTYTG
jgi:solute carrier family 35 protein F5